MMNWNDRKKWIQEHTNLGAQLSEAEDIFRAEHFFATKFKTQQNGYFSAAYHVQRSTQLKKSSGNQVLISRDSQIRVTRVPGAKFVQDYINESKSEKSVTSSYEKSGQAPATAKKKSGVCFEISCANKSKSFSPKTTPGQTLSVHLTYYNINDK
uniref:Uncharacterized protein n=1 Tax=Romanomermis culicivorax TaxID=13658 RepID=A0A915IFS4_ROMCU